MTVSAKDFEVGHAEDGGEVAREPCGDSGDWLRAGGEGTKVDTETASGRARGVRQHGGVELKRRWTPGRGPSGPAPSGDGRLTEEGRDVMQVMFDRVAGLDVGKETVTVCLRTPGPKGRRHAETRTFKTTTGSLHIMRDWL
ncbi:MAG TPA: hypothetical protein VI094_22515, partial [Propionibacteriaceae bacterium]